MSSNRPTEKVSIPSMALAQMAWGLACKRAYGYTDAIGFRWIKPRTEVESVPPVGSANDHYYDIIDRISKGWTP